MKITKTARGYQTTIWLGTKPKQITRPSERLLKQEVAKIKNDYYQGKLYGRVASEDITFQQAVDKYYTLYAVPNNQQADWCHLMKLVEYFKPETKLSAFQDKELIKQWYVDMLAKGWSKQTFRRRLTLLQSVFREMIPKYLSENPCKGAIKFEKGSVRNNSRKRWFTDDEMQVIYQELAKERRGDNYTEADRQLHVCFAQLARNTGLRPDSIERLELSDVDLSGNVVTAKETKNGRTYVLPLNNAARAAIIKAWELQGKPAQGTVFPKKDYSRVFTRLFRRLGWNRKDMPANERAVLYSFRHTFCSKLVMAGYSGKPLWELMGWENGSEEATYAHLSPKFKNTMANTVNCEYKSEGDKLLEEVKFG